MSKVTQSSMATWKRRLSPLSVANETRRQISMEHVEHLSIIYPVNRRFREHKNSKRLRHNRHNQRANLKTEFCWIGNIIFHGNGIQVQNIGSCESLGMLKEFASLWFCYYILKNSISSTLNFYWIFFASLRRFHYQNALIDIVFFFGGVFFFFFFVWKWQFEWWWWWLRLENAFQNDGQMNAKSSSSITFQKVNNDCIDYLTVWNWATSVLVIWLFLNV